MMFFILAVVTLLCAYGVKQTLKQGNIFGMIVSLVAFATFGFSTVLSVLI